jgi:zinc transport system substrate-binding protein
MRPGSAILILLAPLVAAAPAAIAAPAPGAEAPAQKVRVFVSILPQAYLVDRVGGPYVEAGVLVGPGQSPHTFDPAPRQMVELSRAQLFFTIGWPFEKQLVEKARSLNPNLKIIDMREGVRLRWPSAAEAAADRDEPTPAPPPGRGAHAGQSDPHTWLSPRNARIEAANVCRALAAADPKHAAAYQENLAALDRDLEALDAELARTLAPLKGKTLLVYHPAFGYFADAYGLRQAPVEIEGKEPTARQLAALVDRARADGVRVIFVQPQFSARSAEAVAQAIGGAVVPLDDLSRDYLANLRDMAAKIRTALAAEKKPGE